jgi:hypothetical protein
MSRTRPPPVTWLRDQLPAGSHLVLSHATSDSQGAEVASAGEIYEGAMPSFQLRSHAEIRGFFGGFELLDPGLVFISDWRPDIQQDTGTSTGLVAGYGGVAIKR